MRRSTSCSPSDSHDRFTPYSSYSRQSYEKPGRSGYRQKNNYRHGYQGSRINKEFHDQDFIPLDISTPVAQHKIYNDNWCSRGHGYNNANNIRRNYRNNAIPKSNYTPYFAYKHTERSFPQRKRGFREIGEEVDISLYVDMQSFLEDPWKSLIKNSDNSMSINENKTFKIESLSNSDLINKDKFQNELSRSTHLDDTQCSESGNDSSLSFKIENSSSSYLNQTSKFNSSVDLEIDGIRLSQGSENTSIGNIEDNISESIEEKNNT